MTASFKYSNAVYLNSKCPSAKYDGIFISKDIPIQKKTTITELIFLPKRQLQLLSDFRTLLTFGLISSL